MKKKNLVMSIISTFCLTSIIFLIIPVHSFTPYTYDPWLDVNDDGKINLIDTFTEDLAYGTSGTAINKTEYLLRMQTDIFQSGLLLQLPYGATTWSNDGSVATVVILHSLELDQSKPGDQQTVWVRTDTTITVNGTFQVYNPPGIIMQAFFIYSWTPSWPPPSSAYYHPLYNGAPGPYPGTGIQAFSFDLTVPDKGGVYYLYYCCGAEYNMQDAVNKYTKPLWVPYAVIVVGGTS